MSGVSFCYSSFDCLRRQDWATKLGDDFRRIFREQGTDFFEKQAENRYQNVDNIKKDTTIDNLLEDSNDTQTMTPEELFKMRMEIIPRLQLVSVCILAIETDG